MATYLGITFREGYKSFPEFKKEVGQAHPFKKFPPKQREKEIEKAYKIATGNNANDGLSKSKKQSRKAKTSNSKQGVISRDKKN